MIKVLHINCSDTGSTGKIILDISKSLDKYGVESVLCTPLIKSNEDTLKKYQTSFKYEQGVYRRIAKLTGFQYGFAPVSTYRIFRIIKREKPDIVHLHSINGSMVNIYKLFVFLKKNSIPTVVTNHAEFFFTGNCSYANECDKWKCGCGNCESLRFASGTDFVDKTATAWRKMKKCFDNFYNIKITSVSPWITYRAKQSPIMADKEFYTVKNGVDTELFSIRTNPNLRQKLGINEDSKILLHVTSQFSDRPGNIKGGAYIIELAKRLAEEKVVIIVVGRSFVKDSLPDNIISLGLISNQQDLAELYSLADLSVITSKSETFCMPVAESLCCGTPIVGFEAGGPESIAIEEYSQFIDFGDIDNLERIIKEKWLSFKENEKSEKISEDSKKVYDYNIMAQEYYSVYQSLVKEGVS